MTADDDVGDLLGKCATGDSKAFRQLYETRSARLYTVALRITRNPAAASDVVHDAMLQVWRNTENFDPSLGSADAWLVSLVRYRALNAARRVSDGPLDAATSTSEAGPGRHQGTEVTREPETLALDFFKPPRLGEFIICVLIPLDKQSDRLGDFEELLNTVWVPRFGPSCSKTIYIWNALLAGGLIRMSWIGAALGGIAHFLRLSK